MRKTIGMAWRNEIKKYALAAGVMVSTLGEAGCLTQNFFVAERPRIERESGDQARHDSRPDGGRDHRGDRHAECRPEDIIRTGGVVQRETLIVSLINSEIVLGNSGGHWVDIAKLSVSEVDAQGVDFSVEVEQDFTRRGHSHFRLNFDGTVAGQVFLMEHMGIQQMTVSTSEQAGRAMVNFVYCRVGTERRSSVGHSMDAGAGK